jgi:pyridoxamine 5'-phosphate oxidase
MSFQSFQDVIQFINENPACVIATVEGDQPRARGMVVLWAREDGIYYTTAASKNLFSQMKANPRAELCFMKMQPIVGLRVTGEVEIIDDLDLKNEALGERGFLRALGLNDAADPNFVLFRISHGEAHFWTWDDNLKEAQIPRIKF